MVDAFLRNMKSTLSELVQEETSKSFRDLLARFRQEPVHSPEVLERLMSELVDSPEDSSENFPSQPLLTPAEEVKNNPRCCQVIVKSKNGPCGRPLEGNNSVCSRHLPKVKTGVTCPYVMKSGNRIGQPCGKNVPPGFQHCRTHTVTKCVFKEGKKKCGRSISRCSPGEDHCRIHVVNELSLDTSKFVLFLNKFGNREHKYSELIFEDRKVVGKQKMDGSLVPHLSEDDYECVRVYGLPLSEPLVPGMIEYLKKKTESSVPSNPVAQPLPVPREPIIILDEN